MGENEINPDHETIPVKLKPMKPRSDSMQEHKLPNLGDDYHHRLKSTKISTRMMDKDKELLVSDSPNESIEIKGSQPENDEIEQTGEKYRFTYKVNFGRFLQRRMKGQRFMNNRIVTSYYTNLNWFPLSLFKQFKKPVNLYFTLITVLHFMPFSPKKPISQLFTFIFVLLFSMIREFIEDRKRQMLDRFQNKSKTQVYRYGWLSYEEKNWE